MVNTRPGRAGLWAFVALALGVAVSSAGASERGRDILEGPVTVDVVRVIDGDTIAVRAHPWLGVFIETNVRLAGIDAPELHGRCAEETDLALRAKERLTELLAAGVARLDDIQHDKYGGRVRARVLDASGADVGASLIASGLARPYHGERRRPWCRDPGS